MPVPQERSYTAEDYWNLPDGVRAELIDGQLFNMAPPSREHQRASRIIVRQLDGYIQNAGGPCEVSYAPFAVNLDAQNRDWVEPDIVVVCDPSKLDNKGCSGAPDLVVEIASPSNFRHDYITKLSLYERAGVREYWIVNLELREVVVYLFSEESLRVYGFSEPVPVGICGGSLQIDLTELA